jgi:hypothetical protein
LAGVFSKHGIKATFHLNSGKLNSDGFLASAEVAELMAAHEVAGHTVTHPILTHLSGEKAAAEVVEDRRALERLVGYPVRGFSYPAGVFSADVVQMLPALGIAYARTVRSTGRFDPPVDPLTWDPTCHHRDGLLERAAAFKSLGPGRDPYVMLVWGHSFEFDRDDSWGVIEEFCRQVQGDSDIWYASCGELVDYLAALRGLARGADNDVFFNPSCQPVWIWASGRLVEIGSGATVRV